MLLPNSYDQGALDGYRIALLEVSRFLAAKSDDHRISHNERCAFQEALEYVQKLQKDSQ